MISLAHCPHCNFLQISTAVSRFVCKNCRHSPLPKNAKVIFQARSVKEVIQQMNMLQQKQKVQPEIEGDVNKEISSSNLKVVTSKG